ncbi:MAG: 30S ribosomal protein S4 [Candidatus Omnitrophota bacterium]
MARYIGSKCRLCRREGAKLFLKGARCFTEKCAFSRRSYSPGQHGQTQRGKLSDYGLQLREKQKVKRIYGILERQFRKYFRLAAKKTGVTGDTLLQLLERRIDNCLFRSCFAVNRTQARQFVRHGVVYVDEKRVSVPSFLVKVGSKIVLKPSEKLSKVIRDNLALSKDWATCEWLKVESDKMTFEVSRLPQRSDIQFPIQEQLIVELYSK